MQSDKAEKTAFEKRKQESIEYQAAGRRAVETIVGRPEVFKFNTIDEYFYWVRQVANYHYALIQSKGEAGIDVLPPVSVPTSNSSNSKLPSTKRIPAVKPTSKTAEQIDPNNVAYRDWETDRKSTRLNSSHRSLSRMPSSA